VGKSTLLRDIPDAAGFCLSRDPVAKKIANVRALPWHEGLKELGL